jgi:hypothetical protein
MLEATLFSLFSLHMAVAPGEVYNNTLSLASCAVAMQYCTVQVRTYCTVCAKGGSGRVVRFVFFYVTKIYLSRLMKVNICTVYTVCTVLSMDRPVYALEK